MLEAFESARKRRESHEHPRYYKTSNNLEVKGWAPDRKGHARPDSYEGLIIPCPPYALGGDDWSEQYRDYKGVRVSFRNANGEIVGPNDY